MGGSPISDCAAHPSCVYKHTCDLDIRPVTHHLSVFRHSSFPLLAFPERKDKVIFLGEMDMKCTCACAS